MAIVNWDAEVRVRATGKDKGEEYDYHAAILRQEAKSPKPLNL